MPTIAADQTASLTLTDNDSVTISTLGVAIVSNSSGKIAEFAGTRTLGPFAAGSLTIFASGRDCSYEVADGPDGKVIAIGGGYTPPISQYDRALIIPQIRQANAVKGLSRNINDAQYVGAITDAEVYDTEPGALSVGQSTSKALAFHWGKMLWDLAAGESLLVQCRFKTVGATAGARIIFGNSNGAAAEGWNIQLYGPTDSGQAGRLILNYKTSTNASNRQLQPASVGNGSVGSTILPTDAWINLTMVIEGSTRRMDSWVNCQQSLQAGSILQPGSWVPAVKRNFGIGHAPTDDSFTTTSAQAVRIQTLRIAVLPAGQTFANPGWLDLQFNINPYRFFSDADYVGAV